MILLPMDIPGVDRYSESYISTKTKKNRGEQNNMHFPKNEPYFLPQTKKPGELAVIEPVRKYALGSISKSAGNMQLPLGIYMLMKYSNTRRLFMPRSDFHKQRMVWILRDTGGEQKNTDLTLGEKEIDPQETVACLTNNTCGENFW